MRTRFRVAWLAVVLLVTTAAAAHAGQFILRAATTDADLLCQRYNLVSVKVVHAGDADQIRVVRSATASYADDVTLRAQVLADPLVKAFEFDTSLALPETQSGGLAQSTAAILESFATATPQNYFGNAVSSAFAAQPAVRLLRLTGAQQYATGAGLVAVIDTGVDPAHEALIGSLVPGFDFVNDIPGIPDDFGEIAQSTAAILEQLASTAPDAVALLNQSTAAILEQSTAAILEASALPPAFGHGTMIAALIHLVAPTAGIMPLKAFKADGSANLSDLAAAIYYAVDNGATVINMSFVLASPSQTMLDAIAYAAAHRVLCVAAAGNDGVQTDSYPASWPGVISVASTDATDHRSVFSNWGSRVDMSAPGEALITAYPGNHYAAAWGTSFSAALVSGAAAMLHQYAPSLSESAAMKALEDGAEVHDSGIGEARLQTLKMILDLLKHL